MGVQKSFSSFTLSGLFSFSSSILSSHTVTNLRWDLTIAPPTSRREPTAQEVPEADVAGAMDWELSQQQELLVLAWLLCIVALEAEVATIVALF
jgi:hypothetical protein